MNVQGLSEMLRISRQDCEELRAERDVAEAAAQEQRRIATATYEKLVEVEGKAVADECTCGHAKGQHDDETGWCMTVVGLVRHDVSGIRSPMPVHCSCEAYTARDQMISALQEIASYNAEELREWKEENAADMVEIARKALR